MTMRLEDRHILLNAPFASMEEVVAAVAEVMVRAGEVTARYASGMLARHRREGTWLAGGVVLLEGPVELRQEILKSSLVVVQMRKPVPWGDGRSVRLAIALAGKGDQRHLAMLRALTGLLRHQDPWNPAFVRGLDTAFESGGEHPPTPPKIGKARRVQKSRSR